MCIRKRFPATYPFCLGGAEKLTVASAEEEAPRGERARETEEAAQSEAGETGPGVPEGSRPQTPEMEEDVTNVVPGATAVTTGKARGHAKPEDAGSRHISTANAHQHPWQGPRQ